MTARTLLAGLTIIVALLAVPGTPHPAWAQSPITACTVDRGEPLAAVPTVAGVPAGLSLAVLTDRAPVSWPGQVGSLVMTVRHLTLDPGVESAMRITYGPLLYYIERGTVGISINSQWDEYGPGSTALVELGQRVVLRNTNDKPASLIRLQLAPSGKETTVSYGDPAELRGIEQEAAPGPPYLTSRLLVDANVPAMASGDHLVLGCLTWTDLATDARDIVHPGPAALIVAAGQLLVGETGSRVEGECVVFQTAVPHRLRAGEPPPVVLLAAVVPANVELWQSGSESTGSPASNYLSYTCGEDAAVALRGGEVRAARALDQAL
jgi:quercetin dioxygenase-like cupin family protein